MAVNYQSVSAAYTVVTGWQRKSGISKAVFIPYLYPNKTNAAATQIIKQANYTAWNFITNSYFAVTLPDNYQASISIVI